jgi:hypothetical protein
VVATASPVHTRKSALSYLNVEYVGIPIYEAADDVHNRWPRVDWSREVDRIASRGSDTDNVKYVFERLLEGTSRVGGINLRTEEFQHLQKQAKHASASSISRCTVPVMMTGAVDRHRLMETEACQVHRCPCPSARRSPSR